MTKKEAIAEMERQMDMLVSKISNVNSDTSTEYYRGKLVGLHLSYLYITGHQYDAVFEFKV
jgi:hypothetical protein